MSTKLDSFLDTISDVPLSDSEFFHYGTPGMKWGQRKSDDSGGANGGVAGGDSKYPSFTFNDKGDWKISGGGGADDELVAEASEEAQAIMLDSDLTDEERKARFLALQAKVNQASELAKAEDKIRRAKTEDFVKTIASRYVGQVAESAVKGVKDSINGVLDKVFGKK